MVLSLDHYVAFCNNVIVAIGLTKNFCENAKEITKLEEEEMDIVYQ